MSSVLMPIRSLNTFSVIDFGGEQRKVRGSVRIYEFGTIMGLPQESRFYCICFSCDSRALGLECDGERSVCLGKYSYQEGGQANRDFDRFLTSLSGEVSLGFDERKGLFVL